VEIAIVGTGKVAERNYIPSLLRHPDISLTCYSHTLERAEVVGRKFGVAVVRSLDELFERQPETVLVLTGEQQRLQATLALLPFKPKRLFLEKPLVAQGGQAHVVPDDFWDGKRLLQQAQEAGAEVAMIFNYRFFDQTQRARRLIQERNFGPAVNVVALSHFATWSHCIDLILQLAGPVREISAQQGTQARAHADTGAVPDVAASFLLDASATGTLLGTNGIDWTFPLFELIIGFERGRIHFRGLDQDMEVLDYSGTVHEVFYPTRDRSQWNKYDASFGKSVDAYLESIRAGAPPPVPGVAGLLELQFEAGLKQSIAERRPVDLSALFPIDPVH
jgi:predicted dehydrogenase